jgi:hypothetical protein
MSPGVKREARGAGRVGAEREGQCARRRSDANRRKQIGVEVAGGSAPPAFCARQSVSFTSPLMTAPSFPRSAASTPAQ